MDDAEITEVLLKIVDLTERNGIKLPREFGLLVKQVAFRAACLGGRPRSREFDPSCVLGRRGIFVEAGARRGAVDS